MLTKRLQFIVAAALAVVALAVPPAFAQRRGSSALRRRPEIRSPRCRARSTC
jgi:hypothetical protein